MLVIWMPTTLCFIPTPSRSSSIKDLFFVPHNISKDNYVNFLRRQPLKFLPELFTKDSRKKSQTFCKNQGVTKLRLRRFASSHNWSAFNKRLIEVWKNVGCQGWRLKFEATKNAFFVNMKKNSLQGKINNHL
jgi:hypothetical protein